MAAGVRDIRIRFSGDAKGLQKTSAQGEAAVNKFSQKTAKFAAVASTALLAIGAAAAYGAKKAIDAASDYTEASNKADALFKDQVGVIREFEKESTKSWGISKRAALDYTGAIGGVLVASGVNREEAAKLSVQYTKLAADLGSFNNTSTEEAAEALKAALTGEVEQMKKYGVVLNETAIKAEAMASGLIKATKDTDAIKATKIKAELAQKAYNKAVREEGESSEKAQKAKAAMITVDARLEKLVKGKIGDLDAATKRQAIQNIIMKATAEAQGDVARNTDTAAFKQRQLQARMEDLQVTIGQKLLPMYIKILAYVQKFADWAEKNQTTVKALAIAIGVLVAALAAAVAIIKVHNLVVALSEVLSKRDAISKAAQTVAIYAQAAAVRVAMAAQWLWNAALSANPIGIVIIAIAALVAALVLLFRNSETARRIMTTAFNAIRNAASSAFNWIRNNWPLILAILTGPIGLAVLAIVKNWDRIVNTAKAVPGRIKGAFGDALSTLKQVGIDIVTGLVNGIVEKAADLPGMIKDKLVDGPKNLIKKGWKMLSPSKITAEYGKFITEGFIKGIELTGPRLLDAQQKLMDKLREKVDAARDIARSIRDAFRVDLSATEVDEKGVRGKSIFERMAEQAAQAEQFAKQIQKLRKAGLREDLLQQLTAEGPSALASAIELGTNISGANQLAGRISAAGSSLANSETKARTGINIAAPTVNVSVTLDGKEIKALVKAEVDAKNKSTKTAVKAGSKRAA